MGSWEFDSVSPSTVRMEVTQADQFNNDEVSLAEALVRESIQNSTDAPNGSAPVKVCFSIREVTGEDARRMNARLQPLLPHYEACGFDTSPMNVDRFRVLAIEDFNTKGLTGSVVDIDKGNFDRFWRAVGDSGKKGKAGGRWGLGKLVYSSASALKCFYGLTITAENPVPALLGQVVLENHRIGNTFHPAHGFYFEGRSAPLQLQQPVRSAAEVAEFSQFGGLARTSQTGLSLVIPYLLEGIDETSIISGVISNYYFPILAGRLIVQVGDIVIDKSSFMTVAQQHEPVHNIPFDFVKQVSDTLNTAAPVTAIASLGAKGLEATAFAPEEIASMKEQFASGKLVRVRVPVTLKPKGRADVKSFVDLYLKALPENAKTFALIARGAITLPGEKRYFGGAASYAALIANDEEVSSFLGDAENPAHTAWNTKAKKLAAGWRSPIDTLAAIRHSLRHFYALIAEQAEQEDEEALLDFFSVLDEAQTRKGKKPRTPRKKLDIPQQEKAISIRARKGGFDVIAGPAAVKWTFPATVRVRMAYDMIGANPFKHHSPYDFDLEKGDIGIETENANWEALKPNILKLTVDSPEFRLSCDGFDERRDVIVDARAA